MTIRRNPIFAALAACTLLLAACRGDPKPAATPVDPGGDPGGGGNPDDRDGDGVPNASDAFPDDPTRFANQGAILLPRLGSGLFSGATAVNDTGVVAGFSDDATGTTKAARWTVSGGFASAATELLPIAGGGYSAAFGVDANGDVVGESEKADGLGTTTVAVVWPSGTDAPTELRLGTVDPPSAALAVQGGRIVGTAMREGGREAVYWASADADPIALGGGASAAHGIAGNWIVGERTSSSGTRGALWLIDGGAPDSAENLDPLPGDVASRAFSVDAAGVVVGESESASGAVRAVRWTVDEDGDAGPPQVIGAGTANAVAGVRIVGRGPGTTAAVLWDARSPTLLEALLDGAFGFGSALAVNGAGLVAGIADGQGFVSVPQ
jgi:uncharacterized membrane protein